MKKEKKYTKIKIVFLILLTLSLLTAINLYQSTSQDRDKFKSISDDFSSLEKQYNEITNNSKNPYLIKDCLLDLYNTSSQNGKNLNCRLQLLFSANTLPYDDALILQSRYDEIIKRNASFTITKRDEDKSGTEEFNTSSSTIHLTHVKSGINCKYFTSFKKVSEKDNPKNIIGANYSASLKCEEKSSVDWY